MEIAIYEELVSCTYNQKEVTLAQSIGEELNVTDVIKTLRGRYGCQAPIKSLDVDVIDTYVDIVSLKISKLVVNCRSLSITDCDIEKVFVKTFRLSLHLVRTKVTYLECPPRADPKSRDDPTVLYHDNESFIEYITYGFWAKDRKVLIGAMVGYVKGNLINLEHSHRVVDLTRPRTLKDLCKKAISKYGLSTKDLPRDLTDNTLTCEACGFTSYGPAFCDVYLNGSMTCFDTDRCDSDIRSRLFDGKKEAPRLIELS